MTFVLSHTFLSDLLALKSEYEKTKGISLSDAPAPFALTRFFGKTDAPTRLQQMNFLMAVYHALEPQLLTPDSTEITDSQWQAHVICLRVLVVACLHVKTQITETYTVRTPASQLSHLIDEALGITVSNPLDTETQKCCFDSARRWLECIEPLQRDRLIIKTPPLNEHDFMALSTYVREMCHKLEVTHHTSYPITSIVKPLVGVPFGIAGSTAGYMLGEMIAGTKSSTSSLMTASLLTSGVVGMVSTPYVGAILLVPAITSRMLNTFYGVTLSWLLGNCMRLVGEGAGFCVGMSLDLSISLLGKTYTLLSTALTSGNTKLPLSGIRLTDGQRFISGIEILSLDDARCAAIEGYETHPVKIYLEDDRPVRITIEECEESTACTQGGAVAYQQPRIP